MRACTRQTSSWNEWCDLLMVLRRRGRAPEAVGGARGRRREGREARVWEGGQADAEAARVEEVRSRDHAFALFAVAAARFRVAVVYGVGVIVNPPVKTGQRRVEKRHRHSMVKRCTRRCHDPSQLLLQLKCPELPYAGLLCILSEGHRASHETVPEHETLMNGSAAINFPFVRRTPKP